MLSPFLQRLLRTLTTTSAPTPPFSVALFWDLATSKPPSALPPYDAAVRLHLAAASYGRLRLSAAYAHPSSLHRPHLPPAPATHHLCRVCGRRFRERDALLRHFDAVHCREHAKRLRRIESSRGARRAALAAGLSLKLAKYAKAARELSAGPASLGDDLRRAGVRAEPSQTPSAALRARAEEALDEGEVSCLVLVSGDEGLGGFLRLARERRVRSVVVGGEAGVARWADAGFSWAEVLAGKARKAAPSVAGKWRDRDVLKRLEWKYEGEEEEEDVVFEEDGDVGDLLGELEGKGKPWWKLHSDAEESHGGG